MFVMLRLFLAFIMCWYVNYLAYNSYFGEEVLMTSVAINLVSTTFSFLFFLNAKWFSFVYRKSIKSGFGLFFFENILLSLCFFSIFSFPFVGFNLFVYSWLWVVLGVVALFDVNQTISNFLWERRFYDFAGFPDDGLVGEEKLKDKMFLVFSMIFLFPVAAYFFKFIRY